MSILSTNNNSAARLALLNMNKTGDDLQKIQANISTGTKIRNASDGPAKFAISEGLVNTVTIGKGALSALANSQALLETTSNAIASLLEISNQMMSQVSVDSTVLITNGAQINDVLAQLSTAAWNVVNNSSFNGANLLTGTVNTPGNSTAISQSNFTFLAGADNQQNATNVIVLESPQYASLTSGGADGSGIFGNTSGLFGGVNGVFNGDIGTAGVEGAQALIADISTAVNKLTELAATFGAQSSQVKVQIRFNEQSINTISDARSSMVDTDMSQASSDLEALKARQQLGASALLAANQGNQIISKLFQ